MAARSKRAALLRDLHTLLLRETKGRRILDFWYALLSRQDRVYPLRLLVPLAVYNLALKANDLASRPGKLGLARTLKLMRSDVFFNLGYTLLWIGLFGAARRGPLRRAVVFLFHVTTMLAAIVRASAHEYFRKTG